MRASALLSAAVVLATTAVVVSSAWPTLRADLVSMRARFLTERWISGQLKPPDEAAWRAAKASLDKARMITPGDPALVLRSGDVYFAVALGETNDEARRQAHYESALMHYQQAVTLRPRDAHTWARIAAAHAGAGHDADRIFAAWRQAQSLGPYEGHVVPVLAELAMMQWSAAPPDVQDWLAGFYERSAEPQRKALAKLGSRYGLSFEEVEQPGAATPAPGATPPPPASKG